MGGAKPDTWNANKFVTDSALLCYLFCAFIRHPGWAFDGSERGATPRTALLVGRMPPKHAGEGFRAILPEMKIPKAAGSIVLMQSRFGPPVYTLSLAGEEKVRMTGHAGLFRGLTLFLALLYTTDRGWVGQQPQRVERPRRRVTSRDVVRRYSSLSCMSLDMSTHRTVWPQARSSDGAV